MTPLRLDALIGKNQLMRKYLRAACWPTLLLICFCGCSRQQHAAPVNAELARKSLRSALDSWKKGDELGALRKSSPSITVQDMDWKSGYRLLAYEIQGDGATRDANLHCPVKLTLQDPDGREVSREVVYIVGTDPVITVFREMKM